MKKLLLIFIISCLTSACTVGFMYNQLNLIVPWYIERYIALDDRQSRFIKARIEHYHQWHRKNQLPEYAKQIDKIVALLQRLDETALISDRPKESELFLTFSAIQFELHRLSQSLTATIAPDLVDLFLTADNEQLLNIYEQFEIANEAYHQQFLRLNRAELKQLQRQRLHAQLKRWIGRLTSEQEQHLNHWKQQYNPIAKEVLTYRKRWQLRFRDLMTLHHSQQLDISSDLNQLFTSPESGWHPLHSANREQNQDSLTRLLTNITYSLTHQQRKRLIKKLSRLKKSLNKLAKA